MTAALIVGLLAFAGVVLAAAKHQGDRILNEILAAEQREIERRRMAGVQSGFTAGWHGGRR